MDDEENGLELSLGLGCGGSSAKSKGKTSSSSDTHPEDADKGNKVEDDIKNFFQVTTQKQDSSSGSHRTDSLKYQENFFLSKPDATANASMHLNNRGLWDSKSDRSAEIDEERRSDTVGKHKMLFEEITNSKKHERNAKPADLRETKTSYFSITTEDDGSTADNEDVAESEVEGSNQASHHSDGSKQFIGFGGPSNLCKEVHLYPESNVVDLQGQKRHNSPSGTEIKHGNTNFGVQFSVPPVNILNVPYSIFVKDPNSVVAPGTSGHPLISVMQVMPASNGEQQKAAESLNPGNSPVTFGYSHVQLPILDKSTSWLMGSQSQQQHTYAGSSLPGLDKQSDDFKVSHVSMPGIPRHASETALYDLRTSKRARGDDKQQNKEEGTSSRPEDDAKQSSMNLRPKDSSEQSTAEGFSIDFSAIKPGITADMKFGGCGSYPNLPWVSTTAPGPNGRTISGVTYRYNANQIKIVCACHGSHMSPEEFVRHAREENANLENNGLATFPNNNPAASAQS